MLFLAGCPGMGEVGSGTNVAGMAVQYSEIEGEPCAVPENVDELMERVLDLVNAERTSRGLNALTLDPVLCEMAQEYACEMIEQGFFDHINPYTGEGPAQRAINSGYTFISVGENLAGRQRSPEEAMTDWMNSTEGHRENILAHQWSEIGIAVRVGGEYEIYWVLEFGNPPS
jgi:uncharacterized protein YkwD